MLGIVNHPISRRASSAFAALTVVLSLGLPAALQASDFSGPVRVIDGDTIDVGDVRVRLHGIDAPEQSQQCGAGGGGHWACGAWVTEQLRAAVQGKTARCVQRDIDRYGRIVARCSVDGTDIGARLVRDGMAMAYRKYSMDYVRLEDAARQAGRGLHAVAFDSPAQVRKKAAQVAPNGDCRIKGNISRNGGTRIYHVPGQRDYNATRINPAQGERWFCSEAAAQQAGWRKARR